MLETAFAQLRLIPSLLFGRPFARWALEHLVTAMLDTQREFGSLGADASQFLRGPSLDAETFPELQWRRFHTQAVRAARETAYYADLFHQLKLNPTHLHPKDIPRIPLTSATPLHQNSTTFVSCRARQLHRLLTTGTVHPPASIYISHEELTVFTLFMAIQLFHAGQVGSEDVVHIIHPPQASHLGLLMGAACIRLGATVQQTGLLSPEQTLYQLVEKHDLSGHKPQTTVLYTSPAYLGQLVMCGRQMGYEPEQFGLERIILSGGIVTTGLKIRAQQLFGPVHFLETYYATETFPCGGFCDETGVISLDPLHGMVEVLDLETYQPVQPGEIGKLVITPFPPFRQAMLFLRYDTQDVVRLYSGAPQYTIAPPLGKVVSAVRHEQGWTFPRDVQEAVERVAEVSLPARYAFWWVPSGVAVEVVARHDTPVVRRSLETRLGEQNIPLVELSLVETAEQLKRPIPIPW